LKIYEVGIYARISQEDSTSIENQIALLTKFIENMPGWVKTKTYTDNASGANFARPGFISMMQDARLGIINLVLVKDLSRFGRNYLEAGRLLEEELPSLGCRFVALSDGIDTDTGENDIIPFINAINDFYVRDISHRVKSVMLARAKDGQKLTGRAPYGYARDPSNRGRLIIDQNTAGIVRQIFELRANSMSYGQIAGELIKNQIPPPQSRWTAPTIKLILGNEIYIGNTVSLKRGTRSYRDKRIYWRDQSEWVRVENTHEAIIDIKTWDKVAELNNSTKKTASCKTSLFAGLVFCQSCNTKMRFSRYGSYKCKAACSKISEKTLTTLVQEYVNKTCVSKIAKAKLKQQLARLESQMQQLYENKVNGLISAENFRSAIDKAENQRTATENKINHLEQNSFPLLAIDRELLEKLVAKIEIGTCEVINGVPTQNVKLHV